MITRIKSFLGEAFMELKRVNWPTRKETIRLTMVVVVISLLIALLLGFFDFIFSYLLKSFII